LNHKDSDKVHRALITATSFGTRTSIYTPKVKELLAHSDSIQVKSRALEFLASVENLNPTKTFAELCLIAQHDLEKVELLNIPALLKEQKGIVFEQPAAARIAKRKKGSPDARVNTWLYNRWQYITQPR